MRNSDPSSCALFELHWETSLVLPDRCTRWHWRCSTWPAASWRQRRNRPQLDPTAAAEDAVTRLPK